MQLDIQPFSWSCLSPEHPVRHFCLSLYYNIWFDRTILFLIVLNCVTLAMGDPTEDNSVVRNQISEISGLVFTILFTIEMFIKMTALGIFGYNSYFADRWNWLDAIVVLVG